MQPSLHNSFLSRAGVLDWVFRTFLHALFVLPGTQRATFFQLSTSPCMATAESRSSSSCLDHGFPTFFSFMGGPAPPAPSVVKTSSARGVLGRYERVRAQGLSTGPLHTDPTGAYVTSLIWPVGLLLPSCLSLLATRPTRITAPRRLRTMSLDSQPSPWRKSHASTQRHPLGWSCKLLPMFCQRYVHACNIAEEDTSNDIQLGSTQPNLVGYKANRHANECQHQLL